MAAIFLTLSEGSQPIFHGNFTANTVVSVDFLNGLVSDLNSHTIITDVSIDNSDIVQYILTFDDVINWFFFGKGVGQITIRGILFTDCDGKAPGLPAFYNSIGNNRGRVVRISMGPVVFSAIIQAFNTTVVADPTHLVEFSVSLGIVDHQLGRPNVQVNCNSAARPSYE